MCISVSQVVRKIGIAIFAGIAVIARLQRINVITTLRPNQWTASQLARGLLVGERSKPTLGKWMENFVLRRIPVVLLQCRMYITRRVHGRFYGLNLKKGNGRLGKPAMRLICHEENCCSLEDLRKETWIYKSAYPSNGVVLSFYVTTKVQTLQVKIVAFRHLPK